MTSTVKNDLKLANGFAAPGPTSFDALFWFTDGTTAGQALNQSPEDDFKEGDNQAKDQPTSSGPMWGAAPLSYW